MADRQAGRGAHGAFRGTEKAFRALIPTAFLSAGYDQVRIEDEGRRAFAKKSIKGSGHYQTRDDLVAEVAWTPVHGGLRYVCGVHDVTHSSRVARPELSDALARRFREVLQPDDDSGRRRPPPPEQPEDRIVDPGRPFDGNHVGTLRDYSGCARRGEVGDLSVGTLPLGTYAWPDETGRRDATPLYLSRFRNGGRMEHNGVLLCAPQNSGKTTLLERWAEAATQAQPGYATFCIDVKGNFRDKLRRRSLAGKVYCYSTDPHDPESDRINFLSGPTGLDAAQSDRIRQLATALLPSRGFTEAGGLDEFHYRNRVIWLTAFIHLLKLDRYYRPSAYLDDRDRPREVDLADLYELVASELKLCALLDKLLQEEEKRRRAGSFVPLCGVEHWASELAILMDRNIVLNVGQRADNETYRQYVTPFLTALEPFSKHGTLHHKVRSFGAGRLFDLEALLSGKERPVTVILAARQQDFDKSEAVLSMTIKRLQWLLFDRMQQNDADQHPILLLLDETKRIRDFNTAEYVAFAREAKAACVVAYQSLDQIGTEAQITGLLENIGTQIYLGSLVGNTARHFINLLPQRSRNVVTRQVTFAADTQTTTETHAKELVSYLGSAELYHFPHGEWPALVYINDQPRRKPFIVDLTDPAGAASRSRPARPPRSQAGSGSRA